MEFDEGFSFIHPTTISLVGATGSGKTTMLFKLLSNAPTLFNPLPPNLIVLYHKFQPTYKLIEKLSYFQSIKFIQGVDVDFDSIQNALLVIDDQMEQIMRKEETQNLFTKFSHHNLVSVVMLTQNLFPRGKYSKDVRLNVHYYIIMKSFTLQGQLKTLGYQLFANDGKFLPDAYKKATVSKFSYLVIILHPLWEDTLRVVSNIFPNEYLTVYCSKNG